MNRQFPVFTHQAQCQDCSKCIRHCPEKAISIQNATASIVSDYCIACGKCVTVCPFESKTIRKDIGRCISLLRRNPKTVLSVAPSWIAQYPNLTWEELTTQAKQAGFCAVSETAIGAQEVSNKLATIFKSARPGVYISSACPVAVEFIRKYYPEMTRLITPIASPLLMHARMIKQQFGQDTDIVFLGPCVGKKLEADRFPNDIKLALTFQEFAELKEKNSLATKNKSKDSIASSGINLFQNMPTANSGRIYPVEGGMIETLLKQNKPENVEYFCISGFDEIKSWLETLDYPTDSITFLEVLACPGGCINGSCITQKHSQLATQKKIINFAEENSQQSIAVSKVDSSMKIIPSKIVKQKFSPEEIQKALFSIGKAEGSQELNCGGCGYSTCREMANALLSGHAEPDMCVSFMRNLASKKANALLESMPSPVVIVNKKLEIIENNRPFVELFGSELDYIYNSIGTLEGANIAAILNCPELFELALQGGHKKQKYRLNQGDLDFTIQLFTVEPGEVIGAVINRHVDAIIHRDEIAKNAEQVLQKSLHTVQNIACQLGEHMAETEVLLREIASCNPLSELEHPRKSTIDTSKIIRHKKSDNINQ